MMGLARYLGLLEAAEKELSAAFLSVASRHAREPEIWQTATMLAGWSARHAARLKQISKRYGERGDRGPRLLDRGLFAGPRRGGIGLVRDLHDLSTLAHFVHVGWSASVQAAKALRDRALEDAIGEMGAETDRQLAWLRTAIANSAAQALAVPPDPLSELVASRPEKPSSVPKRTVRKARLGRWIELAFTPRRAPAAASPPAPGPERAG